MAQQIQTLVTYKDDINGAEYDESTGETFAFSFDGQNYEIDLSEKNAAMFRKAMEKYVKAARVATRRTNGGGSGRTDLAEVREWAKGNGFQVSDRGRVPQAVLTAFDRFHAENEDA